MNEIVREPARRPTTQAAEGVPRLRWTLAEFERLTDLGLLREDDRIELVGGELVPMSPKGNRHEIVRGAILNWLRRNLPDQFDLHAEPGWRASEANYFEPDFLIGPAGCSPTTIPPADVVLLIEIAHSSLRFDTGPKARSYAALGIREYWVVNAESLVVRIHRGPSAQGYASAADMPPQDAVAAALVPSLTVRLADLRIED
jgi:Uma2 family endonuclease